MTYNWHLVNCDTWMNIHLREVICTSEDGELEIGFGECLNATFVGIQVIDKVQEETKSRADRKPPGVGRGRGRGREDGPGGRPANGIGHGMDDGGGRCIGGGRGRGASGSKPGVSRVINLYSFIPSLGYKQQTYNSHF
ncbi:probable U6 snRNA-associated Sm-like protein LSm4 [Cornus florida]|uniref:probable U6 snRNA-associated Sm-like protein LSm4 n=1 Tax=Cornus florida TaxID=4283 RepID=UPI00289C33DA|nr:probable U6 snRNA-associated Sm-like protein LSm4 [Cornus florida]